MEPINLSDYEAAATEKLPKMVFGYYAGGAGDEITLAENNAAYAQLRLRPRMMRDISKRDTSTVLFGQKIALPVVVAPMALMRMAHPAGEDGVARAAGAIGVPMALSTMSSTPLEDVAQAATGPLWFQLYVYKDRGLTRSLVERAEAAGYSALVLTVDAPIAGNRERDRRHRFRLPEGITYANLAHSGSIEDTSDPSAIAAYAARQFDSSLTWDDVAWLRSITSLPVIVKGVLRGDDAELALQHGAAGIGVSNHGGRQVDTAIPSVKALPEIVAAVDGRGAIFVDGGVRRGTDILKALALGAHAVMLGRPVLWGLTVGGEDGARHVLDLLRDEFDNAMALTGCTSVATLSADVLG